MRPRHSGKGWVILEIDVPDEILIKKSMTPEDALKLIDELTSVTLEAIRYRRKRSEGVPIVGEPASDAEVFNHGSIFLIDPNTDKAKTWLKRTLFTRCTTLR